MLISFSASAGSKFSSKSGPKIIEVYFSIFFYTLYIAILHCTLDIVIQRAVYRNGLSLILLFYSDAYAIKISCMANNKNCCILGLNSLKICIWSIYKSMHFTWAVNIFTIEVRSSCFSHFVVILETASLEQNEGDSLRSWQSFCEECVWPPLHVLTQSGMTWNTPGFITDVHYLRQSLEHFALEVRP